MNHQLSDYSSAAMELVQKANTIIKLKIWEQKKIETKFSRVDLVTETDKEIEKIIISGLKANFPDHKFIGEESSPTEGRPLVLTDEPTWIIDPIDGTMNFVHGNPLVCVSVGLFINKEPYLGIISVPVMEFIFTASKGGGAFLNGKEIHVSEVKSLSNALIYLEGGADRIPEKLQAIFDNFQKLYPESHGYRTSGSAAYDMAMVAMGAADAYLESGLRAWDMAAGCSLVKEAGGVLIDPSGGKFDVMSRRLICASTMELAQEISGKTHQYFPKRDDA